MKNPNPLEQKLASWIPRPPSAKLHDRLFRATPPVTPASAFPWPRLLAATATSLALFTVVFNPARPVDPIFDAAVPRWTILAPSNQWLASYFVGHPSRPRNAPPLQRFDWTNITPSPSSNASPR